MKHFLKDITSVRQQHVRARSVGSLLGEMEEPSVEIGAYRLLKTLGIGAFGKVKREWHLVARLPPVYRRCLMGYCCSKQRVHISLGHTCGFSSLSKREERGQQGLAPGTTCAHLTARRLPCFSVHSKDSRLSHHDCSAPTTTTVCCALLSAPNSPFQEFGTRMTADFQPSNKSLVFLRVPSCHAMHHAGI